MLYTSVVDVHSYLIHQFNVILRISTLFCFHNVKHYCEIQFHSSLSFEKEFIPQWLIKTQCRKSYTQTVILLKYSSFTINFDCRIFSNSNRSLHHNHIEKFPLCLFLFTSIFLKLTVCKNAASVFFRELGRFNQTDSSIGCRSVIQKCDGSIIAGHILYQNQWICPQWGCELAQCCHIRLTLMNVELLI